MDIVEIAKAAGLVVLTDGVIGREKYQSVSGSLSCLRRFGDAYAAEPIPAEAPPTEAAAAAELLALFEQWAVMEGLPLDRSSTPDRTFLWAQTEQAWFGFQGFAAFSRQHKRVAIDA